MPAIFYRHVVALGIAVFVLSGCGSNTQSESVDPVASETTTDTAGGSDSGDNENETAPSAGSWRFVVVGDTHIPNADLLAEMVPLFIEDKVEVVLVPGDIVQAGAGASASEFAQQLAQWKTDMKPLYDAGIGVYPVRGNHEDDAKSSVETWNEAFSDLYALPSNGPTDEVNLTYSFTHRNALFIGVDEYVNIHRVNQSWLDAQLASNVARPHIFVFGHEPAFKAFHSDCLDDYVTERDTFWRSLTDAGAKLYFSGHDHFFDVARVDDGNGNDSDDLYQVIVGSGGGDLFDQYRYIGENSTYTPVGVKHLQQNGYLLVEVSGASNVDLNVTLTFKQRTVTSSGAISYEPVYRFSYNAASQLKYPVIDTGQETFYNNDVAIDAPVGGDAFYGQDAQFNGNAPSYRDNGDGTVTDLHTGLMWVQERGNKMSWSAASAGASSARVGGYDDWRMPTIKELYSLIKFTGAQGTSMTSTDGYIPFIDSDYFDFVYGAGTETDRVIDSQDWSATTYVGSIMYGQSGAFGVNFADGRIKGYSISNGEHYVRYVRGNPAYGINEFVDNHDGTISDNATQLMWTKEDSGVGMNWQQALQWAQDKNNENYLGHRDWRLPNAKELHTLVDYRRAPKASDSALQGAAIDPLFSMTSLIAEGGQVDYPFYWTSTSFKDGTRDSIPAAYIAFGRAFGYMKSKNGDYYELLDVHGSGAQRSDPKVGNVSDYRLGVDATGQAVYGRGPQGDVVRIDNFVRLVRDLP